MQLFYIYGHKILLHHNCESVTNFALIKNEVNDFSHKCEDERKAINGTAVQLRAHPKATTTVNIHSILPAVNIFSAKAGVDLKGMQLKAPKRSPLCTGT